MEVMALTPAVLLLCFSIFWSTVLQQVLSYKLSFLWFFSHKYEEIHDIKKLPSPSVHSGCTWQKTNSTQLNHGGLHNRGVREWNWQPWAVSGLPVRSSGGWPRVSLSLWFLLASSPPTAVKLLPVGHWCPPAAYAFPLPGCPVMSHSKALPPWHSMSLSGLGLSR